MVGVQFTAAVAQDVPEEVRKTMAIPVNWCIFSLWQRLPGDAGLFRQTVRVVSPSGRIAAEKAVEFEMDAEYHRVISRMQGFPVGESGSYEVLVLMGNAEATAGPKEIIKIPMRVVHEPPSPQNV